ncbi:MADS-box transcription factor 14-like [Dendrobium catenatum]|uniref:MADS-box transcription factor 14-like n=1 Tax=Dendrobium catenatum TaxID=906689 RepID=UPI0009F61C64|nr:MADS-box transcription factor 14-like [Dendrobium catenatum]
MTAPQAKEQIQDQTSYWLRPTILNIALKIFMEQILERYMRHSYVEKVFPIKEPESQEDLCHEYEELKRKVDALQRSRRK